MGEGSFRCSLYLSPKVLEVSPWGDQEVLDGAATFEVSLDTIPTTDLFDAFTKTLCVRYDYVTITLDFSCGSRGTIDTLVVNPINGLTGRPVEPFLHLV